MTNSAAHELNPDRLMRILQEAQQKLAHADSELFLDLASAQRIDAPGLQMLEQLVDAADQKHVTVFLRGINVEVYKVMKLARLTSRFSFVN